MKQDFEKRLREEIERGVLHYPHHFENSECLEQLKLGLEKFISQELKLQRAEVIKEISDKLNKECERKVRESFEAGRKDMKITNDIYGQNLACEIADELYDQFEMKPRTNKQNLG